MATKKTTARRSTAKKSTAKKSTAKKSTARKSTAKKSTAKKSTAKKSTARKSTAKKTTARRPIAKKSTARKSTAKKSTARKSTAKRATSLRPRTTAPSAANKKVVSAIEAAWSSGNLPALDKHFAADYRNHAAMPGMPSDLATAKKAHAMAMQAFPDRNVELLDVVAEGDRVSIRTRVTGTNTGGAFWFGAPANDRSIDFESWALYRLEDGKVTESWGLNDGMAALIQLGTWEPPSMPGASPDGEQEQILSLVGAD
jgi:predicted ester cyclase